jgi:Tol biopolymer transport system component
VLYEVTPANLNQQISARVLSYSSEKTLLLAKEPANSYVKVIYSCDMKTGENLAQVTSEQMWDIQSMDASGTMPSIVFHGHPVDGGASTSNLFTINLDGTNVKQLTQNKELVEGIELWWPYFPAFSPNGQKIAFRGNMRTPDPGGYWWGQSIIVMDVDGSNKQILYNEPESNSGTHRDISWTNDGKFLVFLTTESYSTPNERVKVIKVEDGHSIDITQNLIVDGLHTTNLCTSPTQNKIYFNKYEPGGGDLYQISYKVENDQFKIDGSYSMLAEVVNGSLAYGAPKCQKWNGN